MTTGNNTSTAIASRKPAKLTGGRSRSPSLMNNHIVLQMKHTTIHTSTVFNINLYYLTLFTIHKVCACDQQQRAEDTRWRYVALPETE